MRTGKWLAIVEEGRSSEPSKKGGFALEMHHGFSSGKEEFAMSKQLRSMRSVVVSEVAAANGLRMTQKRTVEVRRMAVTVMSRFYKEHRQHMSPRVSEVREDLIVAIMKGESVSKAFERCAGISTDGSSVFGQVRIGMGRKSVREAEIRKRERRKQIEVVDAGTVNADASA